jgi:GNAT superfamily N-acetyltransferase
MATPRQANLEVPNAALRQPRRLDGAALDLQPLTNAQAGEVLGFLAAQTIDNVVMSGLISDNGVESPLNRGAFYAARNQRGELQGVALIGHAMLIEARSEEVLAAFAGLAQSTARAHLLAGRQEKMECFWSYYGQGGQRPRRICRELLFEQRLPVLALKPVPELRAATLEDLPQLMRVNALMAEEESGVNPLEVDPEGFRARLERRIEQGRVRVWTRGATLMFKLDVMAQASGVVYVEGVYVHPSERGRGYGARCLSQLGQQFLQRGQSVCALVNEQNKEAQVFFFKAGYKLRDCYDTIFLQPEN